MKPQHKTFTLYLAIFLFMALIITFANKDQVTSKNITYSQFVQQLDRNNVEKVTLKGDNQILGEFKEAEGVHKHFKLVGNTGETTFNLLMKHGIVPDYEKEEEAGLAERLLFSWGPMILLLVIFFYFLRQLQAGGGKAMSFGKSRARMLNPDDKKVTFKDVAGVEEAKEELEEVVDFLRDPKKYTKLGGKIPKGVILVGTPGTGKTLLAKAVAGEANVPFFSISGSDFVEMFVGVGASRVRDLFEQGKKNAPCIIFIDEIDAVGRHRGSGLGGGHDEREQTLNQLLVEMDGFESNEGVILIAATNRIDVLDPALLRPGRFDRRVVVGTPDVRGRLGILKVHSTNLPLADDVDLEVVAKGTPGFTGADLANLCNEAALQAARYNKLNVNQHDFDMAKDKVLMGPERKSLALSDKEKLNTAYHEAGHTLVGMNLPHTDPIHKVSIMPRGHALGVTQTLPNEEMLSLSRDRAHNFIAFLLGGRTAEEIIFNDYSNGASNDIERATSLAHNMVCNWGMSEKLGPIQYKKSGVSAFNDPREHSDYSERTAETIDSEVRAIIDANHEVARKILTEKREILDRLAKTLMVWETLDEKQVQEIIKGNDIGMPLKVAPPKRSETDDFKVELQTKVEEIIRPAGETPEGA